MAGDEPVVFELKPDSWTLETRVPFHEASIGAEKRDSLLENHFGAIPVDWLVG